MKEQFFPIYRSLILYKHRDFKGKIPSTNNITENIIGGLATKFEKRKYPAPIGYDEWLKAFYGDYRKDLPKEKQVSLHKFKAYYKGDNNE